MKNLLLIIILMTSAIAAEKEFFSIQIMSLKTKSSNAEIINKIKKEIRKDVTVFSITNYKTVYYGKVKTYKEAQVLLAKAKSVGYNGSAIRKTERFNEKFAEKKQIPEKKDKVKAGVPKKEVRTPRPVLSKLSNSDKSNLLLKISIAHKKGSVLEEISLLEQLVYTGDLKYETNLALLYGKVNKWNEVKDLIEGAEKNRMIDLIYAYGYGEISVNDSNIENRLLEYIKQDNSQKLKLLLAVENESNKYMLDAYNYYKEAYTLNPSDKIISFMYGRILDIMGEYKQALIIYGKSIQNENADTDFYLKINKRILYLEDWMKDRS